MFSGHRHCGIVDIMFLVCHVILQDNTFKGQATLEVRAHQGKLSFCQIWWSQGVWQGRYNGFCLSNDLARPGDQSSKLFYGQKPHKVSHYPTKSGGHRRGDSDNVMVLVCHVISLDNVIKRSCGFMSRSPSKQVTILQSVVAIATLVVEFLVCHVISQDHVIKRSCDFMDGSLSW